MDSPDPEGETHVGGDFGDYTVAHEYGHALQDAKLRSLPGDFNGYNCPSLHNISGAYDLECAYFKGFADYHGAAAVEDIDYSGNRYKDRTENNSFCPGNYGSGDRSDGAIIEGAVAAFLYDLTDPANEPHDNVEYPGSYVANIIKTCKVDGEPADGIDHLIACFQREIPSYSWYFDTRGNIPSSFSESASEPSGWNRTDIIKLWRKNLYGEDYDGDQVPEVL